jgi:hypothetical protein
MPIVPGDLQCFGHISEGGGSRAERAVAGGQAIARQVASGAAAGGGGASGQRGEGALEGGGLACRKKVQREHMRNSGRPMYDEAFGGARLSSIA